MQSNVTSIIAHFLPTSPHFATIIVSILRISHAKEVFGDIFFETWIAGHATFISRAERRALGNTEVRKEEEEDEKCLREEHGQV